MRRLPDSWNTLSALLALATISGVLTAGAAAAAPVAKILTPTSGFKLRQGQTVAVAIEVDGGVGLSWTLSLQGPHGGLTMMASGTASIVDATVAAIDATTLSAGETYALTLVATDSMSTAGAEMNFSIPDPQYTLIPLHEGNLSLLGLNTYAVDAAGVQVIYPRTQRDQDPVPIQVLNLATGGHPLLLLPIANNEGVKFSGDGERLYFQGQFHYQGGYNFGLGFVDITSQTLSLSVPTVGSPFFSVDLTGRHIVYQTQTEPSLACRNPCYQYALYTEGIGTQQLTTSPDTIAITGTACLAQFGTRPFISPDGGRVVFITHSTLGIEKADPAVGCRVYAYDVATQAFTQLVALPSSLYSIDIPAWSDDGRWLSFPVVELGPSGYSPGLPALVDLQSGGLSLPVVDTGSFTSFDSVVTREGGGIILSTEADLDPRVGNGDHNLELFYYDRATGEITQITETTAGVGQTPGGCASYRPSVSADGSVMAFAFARISTDGCYLDGPQRNESDGFNFAFVRALRKRQGNQPVVLDPLADQEVVAGNTLNLTLTAHDPDGDLINFFAQVKDGTDVPTGSTITDNYDGTATFVWPTTTAQVGDYVLRLAAFDEGGGEQFQDVTISVLAHSASSCTGDCNGDQQVMVDEIILLVGYALTSAPVGTPLCPGVHQWCGGPSVTIDCIISAVNNALNGCA